jgi:hypothetical protein
VDLGIVLKLMGLLANTDMKKCYISNGCTGDLFFLICAILGLKYQNTGKQKTPITLTSDRLECIKQLVE